MSTHGTASPTTPSSPVDVPLLTLSDGHALPAIGLGTYRLRGAAGADAVARAIRTGYRLIDSAFSYENEGAVGAGVRDSDVDRSEITVTSKLPGRHHAYDQALAAIEESVYRMGIGPIDLMLVHWPNPLAGRYVEAWQALLEARERGLVRSIGVSNFLPEHLERIIAATGVAPVVDQIEIHPRFPQDEAVRWNADHGIRTEAWSPLGRASGILADPVLQAIAREHGRTVAQIVLRWHVQRGVVPIPKAASPDRQRENLAVFDFALSESDLARIAELARPDGRLKGQDPATYEEF
ncbi:MAG: Aldo/keto reductase [Pseudoclavibacter caeni]|jgi:diketogulonate reductase-like aldo/keto reductase